MADAELVSMLRSGQEDLQWFDSNLSSLIEGFNNRFVAFRNKKVIESSSELDKLISSLKKNGIDTSNVFIKFVSKVRHIL